jgi:hypothetical protein
MGVVYEAIDRDRQSRVALKTLSALDADAILRFKKEFRSLQDIQHENLVDLGELLEEDGQLYFTMELVRGIDFIEYVRPRAVGSQSSTRSRSASPANATMPVSSEAERAPAWHWLERNGERFDEERLRAAFAQLASGLVAIHAANKVHRDIKPSNVLVTPEGRVVILDFGLVVDIAREKTEPSVVGTAHFMAPEQAAAGALGPEADWYSMGVMLYIALTGYYPFQFAPEVALEFKQQIEPPPPGMMVEGLPSDLEELCIDLLRLDPAERPKGREVLERLHVDVDPDHGPISSRSLTFIGRRNELAALDAAFAETRRGAAIAVLIEGESGLGKSALVRRFLDARQKSALVIAGRCYERESVPYKAVDELIDALGAELERRSAAELGALLPPNAALLGAAFPVLRKIEALASAPRTAPAQMDPHELRALMFTALRELLRRLAAQRPLILAIDDLQWSDSDSLALLAELMRPPDAPKILLVATIRSSSEGTSRRLRPFLAPEVVRHIDLHRLPTKEAEELVAVLLYSAFQQSANDGAPRSDTHPMINIEAVVSEAGGHPLFLDALVRHRLLQSGDAGPVRLEEALWARIQRLEASPRALLELLSTSGRPLPQGVVARALEASFDDLSRRIAALRAANLARTTGTGHEALVEVFHDRIRETVMTRLDPPSKRALHRRLAEALEATGRGDAEALALHWRDAGDAEKAASYAARAGDQAAAALAFDRAARLFRMALDLHPRDRAERLSLHARRGDALANAGRGAEAAETYLGAARYAPPNEALDLRRRAAESQLRSGDIDEGLAGLRTVLGMVQMDLPKSPAHALALLALRKVEQRLRGLRFEEQSEAELDPSELAKIDVCWTATLGLGMVDPLRGACFQAQHLLLALRAGEPYRASRALALEAAFAAGAGAPAARVSTLLDQARALALRNGSPHALALVLASTGVALFFQGRYAKSVETLDQAEATLRERCSGVSWERATTLIFSAWALWFMGDLRELCERFPRYLREAEERGDRYLEVTLRAGFSNAAWLVQDDPDRAEREAEDAALHWSNAGFHAQHAFAVLSRVEVDLYRGEGETARSRLLERWHELDSAQASRVPRMRVHLTHLRARTALAAAPTWESQSDLLAEVARSATSLEREQAPGTDALAATLRAALCARKRDAQGAQRELLRALSGFEAAAMALHAAVARYALGEVEGGDAGRAKREASETWMRAQGVAAPERMRAMLLPGRFGR